MIPKLKELEAAGCDMKGAIHRCIDDEEFLVSCIQREMADPQFEALKKALEEKNVKAGFEAAHGLKGVISNLGLTGVFNELNPIVETLRAGSTDNLMPQYEKMMFEKHRIEDIINSAD
ncbi:MAG: Hpt domain-containing protein [Erysipelotrichia bacterium]|nr:Hpt domain-containing protein [Erysipelotrichia bacterium]